jgi:hydrogenase expression/formation protein HypE
MQNEHGINPPAAARGDDCPPGERAGVSPAPNASCPLPITQHAHVLMAHGGGGQLMHQLFEHVFGPAFGNPLLDTRHDSAQFSVPPGRLAMTTDSYVVRPIFFPGGDVGSLAVHGTVNDLAMSGARPLYLSCGFILEEGLALETLGRVVCSMRDAARRCGVQIITGDTKVVDKGRGDGLFINTTGLGVIETAEVIGPTAVQPGDAVVVSGDLGRHGMAIMAVREGLQFESAIESDAAPVHEPVLALLRAGIKVHCLRDLTRGGLASALNEIATSARVKIAVEQTAIPVREDVHAACELLGLDPLHVANEGRFVLFVPAEAAPRALAVLRAHPVSAGATLIGRVTAAAAPLVTLRSAIGASRILDMPSGEQLPRIC